MSPRMVQKSRTPWRQRMTTKTVQELRSLQMHELWWPTHVQVLSRCQPIGRVRSSHQYLLGLSQEIGGSARGKWRFLAGQWAIWCQMSLVFSGKEGGECEECCDNEGVAEVSIILPEHTQGLSCICEARPRRHAMTELSNLRFQAVERRHTVDTVPGWRWCLNPKCKAGQVHHQTSIQGQSKKSKEEATESDVCVCHACGTKACVPCDRPDHHPETRADYQTCTSSPQYGRHITCLEASDSWYPSSDTMLSFHNHARCHGPDR